MAAETVAIIIFVGKVALIMIALAQLVESCMILPEVHARRRVPIVLHVFILTNN
jgi:hypothetical protein